MLTFDVCVTDGSSDDCETITVTVTNVSPTVVITGPTNATAGETLAYTYVVTDPGADTHMITESCGADPTWIDTAAPNSSTASSMSGLARRLHRSRPMGDQVNGTGNDALLVTVTAAGTPPSLSPSPSPSQPPNPSSPSATPGAGGLPDTAMGDLVSITVTRWLVAAVSLSSLALALGSREAPAARRRMPKRR